MSTFRPRRLTHVVVFLLGLRALGAADFAIPNGGFEAGLAGWKTLFTREPQTGQAELSREQTRTGLSAAKITHTGVADWSFETNTRLAVVPGDLIELTAWTKIAGDGNLLLAASTWGADNKVISWSYGSRTSRVTPEWQELSTRFVVPPGVTASQPRFLGGGKLVAWLDDVSVVRKENVFARRPKNFPAALRLSNAALDLTLHTADGTFDVVDRRSSRRWTQRSLNHDTILKTASVTGDHLDLALFHAASGLDITARLQLDADRPEFTISIAFPSYVPIFQPSNHLLE